MLIIQLGNLKQCRDNGVPGRGVFTFGVQTEKHTQTYGKSSFLTKGRPNIPDIWSVTNRDATTFKLELIKE